MSTVLFWFRNDLRLHDRPALHAALPSGGAHLLPVACRPVPEDTTPRGFARVGPHRRAFTHFRLWFELLWRDYFRLPHLQWGAALYRARGLSQQPPAPHDPRGGRRFSPVKQAQHHDPDGAYLRRWDTL